MAVFGLTPGQQLSATLFSEPLVITGIDPADETGRTSFSVSIPRDFAVGAHTLVIEGAGPEALRVAVIVTSVAAPDPGENEGSEAAGGSTDQLASTGLVAPVIGLTVAALAMLMLGLALPRMMRASRFDSR